MNDIAKLTAEVEAGDGTAMIPLADELIMEGHPHGEELMELALLIRDCDDWSVVMQATANFQLLMKAK